MALQKKMPNGRVAKASIMEDADAGYSGLLIYLGLGGAMHKRIGTIEGDEEETRILLNDEAIKELNIKIIHCDDEETLKRWVKQKV